VGAVDPPKPEPWRRPDLDRVNTSPREQGYTPHRALAFVD
jgi:hypothetical protein